MICRTKNLQVLYRHDITPEVGHHISEVLDGRETEPQAI